MDKYIKAQDRALAEKQLAAYKRIARTLQASRAQILELIMQTEGFQQDLLVNTMANIDVLMAQLRAELNEKYNIILKEGAQVGTQHQLELVKQIVEGRVINQTLKQLVGPVEVTVLNTLEMNVNTYLDAFAARLRERIKNTIQQSFIHGRSESQTMQVINQQYGTEITSTQRAVHHIYQSAYNVANHEVLVELEKVIPGMMKEAYAELDRRTTQLCQSMHGQTKEVNEPFVDPASGSEFMYPPFVYGNENLTPKFHLCRTRSIPRLKDDSSQP